MDRNALLAGTGLGALLMFIADPNRGSRRRAMVRAKAVRGARVSGRVVAATATDLANRTRGVAANVWGNIRPEPVDDARLVERVRAALGHVCSHPRAIGVEAVDGGITLRVTCWRRKPKGSSRPWVLCVASTKLSTRWKNTPPLTRRLCRGEGVQWSRR